jgi:methionyl-tRNA formyltransferase
MARIVFMGTPDFAVPSLQGLLDADAYDVIGVVTQPDRPAGRGRGLRPSPVKATAQQAGAAVFQPRTLRTPEAYDVLAGWQPDLIVVAAFGQILRENVLDLPAYGCVNVHASLLPRWRGASPIQAAIRAGDAETGITIMRMEAGLDTGPVLSQRAIPIALDETGQSLHDRLALLGRSLLLDTLPGYLSGTIVPQPQPEDEQLVTYAGQIRKEDGQINWADSAAEIDRQVRAFAPWPGTFTFWDGQLLKIISGRSAVGTAAPGAVTAAPEGFAVGTGRGLYVPHQVQMAGKKAVSAADFVRGYPGILGASLG